MKQKEYISKHLGVPYVYLPDLNKYICANGVAFTKEEYLQGIDLKSEYEKREAEGELYDYAYAKSTGILRRKAVKKTKEESLENEDEVISDDPVETPLVSAFRTEKTAKSIMFMCLALMVTSFGSMYISTLHTATYLFDYVDKVSAWLMSGVITVYCATAFEVVLLYADRKHYILSGIFATLWVLVLLFSMITTVSVFYDKYNFTVLENKENTREESSMRLSLEMLQKKETALRESIELKKQDIEHRQSLEYATRTQQIELSNLQKELQDNLNAQLDVVKTEPDAVKDEKEVVRKESLFAFLGRLMRLDGGILEFIMSTLSAIFINLISPLSVSVVVSFLGGMKNESRKEYN